MTGIKSDLIDFLNQVWQCIDGELRVAGVTFKVRTEGDLDRFIRLESEDDKALLQILGYTNAEVERQPPSRTVIGRTRFHPDYVLHRQQKPTVIIDLKSPTERLDDPRWAEQIDSYCRAKEAPLGLLFNGTEALLFANLSHVHNVNRAHLEEYKEQLAGPILKARRPNFKAMVDLLTILSTSELTSRDEGVRKASSLVRNRIRELVDGSTLRLRQENIRKRLEAIKEDDVALGKMLSTACSADKILRSITPKPTTSELLDAWKGQSPLINSPGKVDVPARSGANPRLKAKLAEVCAARGWDEGWAKDIKRLRYRLDGVTDNQFRRMKQTPGVPPDLCIPGYSTQTADFIIEQLEQLLKK